MNDFQRKNIALTKHALQRIKERGESREAMLRLIRASEKAYEIHDRSYFKNKGFTFVCKEYPRHLLVITAYKEVQA